MMYETSLTLLTFEFQVYQERMLAPRILHFGREQVWWQCTSLSACESFPKGLPLPLNSMAARQDLLWRRGLHEGTFANELSTDERVEIGLDHIWQMAVKEYTECDLTRKTDKLVALNGIVDALRNAFGETYVAGLWAGLNLVDQLAWQVQDCRQADGSPSERQSPDKYRAPSWAWPSVDGVILFPDRFLESKTYRARIPPEWVHVEHEDATKIQEGASLQIQGKMLRLQFKQSSGRWIWQGLEGLAGKTWFEVHPDEANWHEGATVNEFDMKKLANGVVDCPVLLLEYLYTEPEMEPSGRTGSALLLRVAGGGTSAPCFRRVGCIKFRNLDDAVWSRLEGPFLESESAAGSRSYDAAQGHIITIL
jgi:hypothetical protein